MFRSRKTEKIDIVTSSLSNGNASIVKKAQIAPVQKENKEMELEEEEEEDDKSLDITIESMSAVIAAAVQMSSSGGSPSSLSLGSASILQPFSKTEKPKNASRFSLFPWRKSSETKESLTSAISPTGSNLTLSRSSNDDDDDDDDSSLQSSPRHSIASSPKIADDGRDELQYRGIQIKEIKSTMKTLVISDDVRNPMPKVKLERPGFARINY